MKPFLMNNKEITRFIVTHERFDDIDLQDLEVTLFTNEQIRAAMIKTEREIRSETDRFAGFPGYPQSGEHHLDQWVAHIAGANVHGEMVPARRP